MNILSRFTDYFGRYIPISVPNHISEIEKISMVNSLSISDAEDPRKIYCRNVREIERGQKRSMFNADKAKGF